MVMLARGAAGEEEEEEEDFFPMTELGGSRGAWSVDATGAMGLGVRETGDVAGGGEGGEGGGHRGRAQGTRQGNVPLAGRRLGRRLGQFALLHASALGRAGGLMDRQKF
jgi:hypothetical protein